MRVIKLEWLKNRYNCERFVVLAAKWGITIKIKFDCATTNFIT